MEFQLLPDIGLRTSPNTECSMIQDTLKISILCEPTKIVLTEGNRRVIKASGDPILLEMLHCIGPLGANFGSYRYRPYNIFMIESLKNPWFSRLVSGHENGHAHHAQTAVMERGEVPAEVEANEDNDISKLNRAEIKDLYLARKLWQEGYAEWVATAAVVRSKLGPNAPEEKIAVGHLEVLSGSLKIARGNREHIPYHFGHVFVFKAIAFLMNKCGMTIAEALKIIALNPPTSLSQFKEKVPRTYLQTLNLPVPVPETFSPV